MTDRYASGSGQEGFFASRSPSYYTAPERTSTKRMYEGEYAEEPRPMLPRFDNQYHEGSYLDERQERPMPHIEQCRDGDRSGDEYGQQAVERQQESHPHVFKQVEERDQERELDAKIEPVKSLV